MWVVEPGGSPHGRSAGPYLVRPPTAEPDAGSPRGRFGRSRPRVTGACYPCVSEVACSISSFPASPVTSVMWGIPGGHTRVDEATGRRSPTPCTPGSYTCWNPPARSHCEHGCRPEEFLFQRYAGRQNAGQAVGDDDRPIAQTESGGYDSEHGVTPRSTRAPAQSARVPVARCVTRR